MDKLVVLDFGSQYSHLICRRIREANVYCELLPYNTPAKVIKEIDPKGIIFSGGPASVYAQNAPKPDKEIFKMGKPLLGICYGHQVLVDSFGGKVKRTNSREYGRSVLIIEGEGEEDTSDLFKGLGPGIMNCWMSHADAAEKLPEGFKVLARTESSFSAAIGNPDKKFYGIQFHPEVVHTEKGTQILKNFAQTISGAKPEWDIGSFIESTIKDIRKQVGKEKVLAAVSGGIDSTTVAALMHRAIGDQLSCVFINHGLLRQDEEKDVVRLFKDHLGINIIYVDAEKQFLSKLKGVSDPEEKRKIIGEEFANVFAAVVKRKKEEKEKDDADSFQWLAQGTLYPDVIESGVSKGPAAVIKTHHNVGGLPKWLNLKVIEPLRYLYKDEVRKAAKLLGVPDELLKRHPFPGPGLAVRIIGEVTPEKIRICKHASKIVEDELKSTAAFAPTSASVASPAVAAVAANDNTAGWYDRVWQAYAAVGDDRAVGVLGDERVYGHIVTIRIVESVDAMTADWSRLPYELIEKISNRITNEVEGVTWVTYAVSSKPPATIEPQ
ncbi:MAG: glutamine-hydrolyzing GMP synthase [Thermoproteota archaeon]|jgi:GMP synthase (glutamine-hydrolysing)|nr:glutamine-hydrolyzing GMP synthase [Thermoproteota archaeon]